MNTIKITKYLIKDLVSAARASLLFSTFFSLLFILSETSLLAQTEEDFTEVIENETADFEEISPEKRRAVASKNYKFGSGIFINSTDNNHVFRLTGYIQSSLEHRTDARQQKHFQRFRVRRAYLNFAGRASRERLRYRLRINFAEPSFEERSDNNQNNPEIVDNLRNNTTNAINATLLDAFISYNVTKDFKFTFGQRTTTTDNKEIRISSWRTQFPERSLLTGAFSSLRELGLFMEGRFRRPRSLVFKPSFIITTGDGQNSPFRNFGGLKYGFRFDFLPKGTFLNYGEFSGHDLVRELSPKVLFGFYYSYNVGITSRRGRNGGRFLYFDNDGNTIIPSNYEKGGFDLILKHKGWNLLLEYVYSHADLVDSSITDTITSRTTNYSRTQPSGNPITVLGVDEEGNNITERITYREHIRNQLILGSAFNIQFGYLFPNSISIDFRYSRVYAAKNSFLNNTLFYNRPASYTIGVTRYHKGAAIKQQHSLTYVELKPRTRRSDGFSFNTSGEYYYRLLIQFAF